MCTLTWIPEPAGYQVFFNRDELRTRRPAEPPRLRRTGSMAYAAPADGDHGGSWIAVNERGLALCLLNGYRAEDASDAERLSRGLLITSLADAHSPAEVGERVRAAGLARFRSFLLVAFHPVQPPRFCRWQGGELERGPLEQAAMPLVSSSFARERVVRARQETFVRFADARAEDPVPAHLAFHADHGDGPGPESVCMHRPDAQTVSFSRLAVDAAEVRFFYAPNAPHEGVPDRPAVAFPRR